jgi:hypothetical protein
MSSPGQIVGGFAGGVLGFFMGGNVALGASIGMAIGGAIDPPKGPHIIGPRLDDLSIQTSTYGAPLARAYGAMSVVGNLFWLEGDKLKETSTTESQGGKGGPTQETTTYHYSATFAVGLLHIPDGATVSLRRLWIDTDLVVDAGSTSAESIIASQTQEGFALTFYNGSDDQLPNPRMQADKGIANVSAYPGMCYIVIDDLDLEKYSNTLMRAQVKAELVISAAESAEKAHLADLVAADTGADYNWTGSVRFTPSGVVVTYTPIDAYDYDVRDLYVVNYEYGVGEPSISAPVAIDDYHPANNWETKTRIYIDQSATDCVGFSLYASNIPWSRVVFHGSGGELMIDTGMVSPSVLPYYDWHSVIDSGESVRAFLFYPGEKIHVVSNAAVSSSASTFNIRRVGASDNYFFGVDAASGSSTTVYKIDRETLTLVDTFTQSVYGTYAVIYVESDTVFYTASPYSTGGSIYKWVNGVATDTGLVGVGNGGLTSVFAMYSQRLAHFVTSTTGERDYQSWIAYRSTEATPAKLRDIVTAECALAGIPSSSLDLAGLVNDDVRGYKIAARSSVRAALEPLQAAFPFNVAASGYKLRFVSRGGSSVATIPSDDLGATSGNDLPVLLPVSREMESQLPYRVNVRYSDSAREYDTGEQYAERPSESLEERTVELAINLTADEAAQKADVLLEKEWVERTDLGPFTLPPTWSELEAADVVTIEHRGQQHEARLTRVEYLADGRLQCSAKLTRAAAYVSTAKGSEPLTVGQSLVPLKGSTQGYLLDIPMIRSEQDVPGMSYGLAGLASGWPGASLVRSDDNGASYQIIGSTNARAKVFVTGSALSSHHGYSIDHGSALVVTPRYSTHTISSITEEQLYAGQNLAAYGIDGRWEIVAFKTAADNTGSYTLANFLRGMFGTEWASGLHQSDDYFIMLDTTTISFFGMPTNTIGSERLYRAVTQGAPIDSAPDVANTYEANNLRPLSPVDITGSRDYYSLDWTISWQRRTRHPVEVFSGVTVPLGETSESYEIEVWSSSYGLYKRTLTSSSNSVAYTAAEQITDFGVEQQELSLKIRQISSAVGDGFSALATLNKYAPNDPYGTSVILLLHMNDAGLTDVLGHTITVTGAVRSATESKFGGYSAYFDGSGDRLYTPMVSEFNIGYDDFTLEFWYYPVSAIASDRIIQSRDGDTYAGIYLSHTSATGVQFYISSNGTAFVGGGISFTVTQNAWQHIAIVRSSGEVRAYKDGAYTGTAYAANVSVYYNAADSFFIGGQTSGRTINGYIDDFRYTRAARYLSNFSVPADELPNP